MNTAACSVGNIGFQVLTVFGAFLGRDELAVAMPSSLLA